MTDPYNRGTFNYFDPESNPNLHTLFDVVPYYLLGNSPEDALDFGDRIDASVEGALFGLLGY